MRTIFMGSPSPVIPILETLIEAPFCQLLGVVSQPAKPAGRKRVLQDPPVAEFARQNRLELWQPQKASSPEFLATLKTLKPDVIITAAYGQILSQDFLQIAKRAVINIHPSLLPKYRGATPVQSSLIDGAKETGVTILFTVKKLDAGPIINQVACPVFPMETSADLMPRLFQKGAGLLADAFAKLSDPNFCGKPQNEESVTHCHKMEKSSGNINWQQTALEITQKFQGFQPWPGIFGYLGGKKIEFTLLDVPGPNLDLNPGQFIFQASHKRLAIQCKTGSLQVLRVKPEGRKDISAAEYWHGQKSQLADTFGTSPS